MIVYYNPETFSITGMSHSLDLTRNESYIETDDPLALDIFLGKEKLINYVVSVRTGSNRGVIKLKQSKGIVLVPVNDKVYKIPKIETQTEFKLLQCAENKTIELQLIEDSKNWWKTDPTYKERKVYIIATLGDPYTPLWVRTFAHNDFDNTIKFNYQGTDNITFYTPKLFYSYSHEIKSC